MLLADLVSLRTGFLEEHVGLPHSNANAWRGAHPTLSPETARHRRRRGERKRAAAAEEEQRKQHAAAKKEEQRKRNRLNQQAFREREKHKKQQQQQQQRTMSSGEDEEPPPPVDTPARARLPPIAEHLTPSQQHRIRDLTPSQLQQVDIVNQSCARRSAVTLNGIATIDKGITAVNAAEDNLMQALFGTSAEDLP